MSDNIIQLNEDLIKHDLKDLVRSSVEETLNALHDHEADELVNASKCERTENRNGYREIIGVAEGMKEDFESWHNFFIWLKERGLTGVRLIVGDKCLDMLESIADLYGLSYRTLVPYSDEQCNRAGQSGNQAAYQGNRGVSRRAKCHDAGLHQASDWGTKRYLNMDHLFQMKLMNNTETAEASVG